MGTGYVRNDTANNIADGNIINAADFDGEYDAIEAAFNASTGHTHDGTSAEGAPIEVVGPSQDVVITASAIRPKTTNTVDLGTSSLEFKDAYFDGTVTADGLTVDGDATISSASPTLVLEDTDGAAQDDARLQVGASIFNIKRDSDNLTRLTVGLSTGDISFYEDTGTTAKLFWDASAESLGIGTTSPSQELHIASTTPALRLEDTDGGFAQFDASDGNLSIQADQGGATADSYIRFQVDSTERMRIDSSGNVGIGTSSPSTALDIKTGTGNLQLGVVGSASGQIIATNTLRLGAGAATSDPIQFFTGGSEAMRIDSSGNVLVGKTSTAFGTAGTVIKPTTGVTITRSAADPLALNRLSTDGEILGFYKDGSTVGSIGTYLSDLNIGNNDVGLYFSDGFDQIMPFNMSTNIQRDAAIDLGRSTARFKDLYLSGGAYLGGTGSANKLDDYEEGTWTPAITAGSGGSSIVSGTNTATYTKIGRLVFCQVRTNCSSSSTSRLHISNLPFTNAGGNAQLGVMSKHGTNGGSFYALSAGEFAAYSYDGGIFTAQDAHGVFRASFTYETS